MLKEKDCKYISVNQAFKLINIDFKTIKYSIILFFWT